MVLFEDICIYGMQIEHHLLTNNLASELEASLSSKQPYAYFFLG